MARLPHRCKLVSIRHLMIALLSSGFLIAIGPVWLSLAEFRHGQRDVEYLLTEQLELLRQQVVKAIGLAQAATQEAEDRAIERLLLGTQLLLQSGTHTPRVRRHLRKMGLAWMIRLNAACDSVQNVGARLSSKVPSVLVKAARSFCKRGLQNHSFRRERRRCKKLLWRWDCVFQKTPQGSLAVCADGKKTLQKVQTLGIGRVLNTLHHGALRYGAVQSPQGTLASSGNIASLPSLSSDPFLAKAYAEKVTRRRVVSFRGRSVYELVSPIHLNERHTGLLRLGLDLSALRNARQRRSMSLWISFLASCFVLLFVGLTWRLYRRYDRMYSAYLETQRKAEFGRRQEALGRMAAVMAHEIRNPLNAIAMIVQRLGREYEPVTKVASYQKMTGLLLSETRRLDGIVHQVLDLSRPKTLELTYTTLEELLEPLVEQIRPDANARGIALETSIPTGASVKLATDATRQALLNLVRNAFDAVELGEDWRVQLTASCQGENIRIVVRDFGPGLKHEDPDKAFELFYTTKQHGTGLGLAICQDLIQRQGGSLTLRNAEDGPGAEAVLLWTP